MHFISCTNVASTVLFRTAIFTAAFLGRSWCTAAASLLVRVSDLIIGIPPCVGRLKRVLCACSEKGVCRQYRPSPFCITCHLPVFREYDCAFSRIFHVTKWSALPSLSFQMNLFSVIPMYMSSPHCVGLCDSGLIDGSLLETFALQ